MRVIKRYPNRKLYDTVDSRYITLPELANLIRSGEEFQVLEKVTGEDRTSQTLAQIMHETELKKPTFPIQLLTKIIREGSVPA